MYMYSNVHNHFHFIFNLLPLWLTFLDSIDTNPICSSHGWNSSIWAGEDWESATVSWTADDQKRGDRRRKGICSQVSWQHPHPRANQQEEGKMWWNTKSEQYWPGNMWLAE